MKTPLSWLQLTHEKMRLLIALAGIGFADMLMFVQLGFKTALFDSNVKLHHALNGDIFFMSPQSDALGFTQQFSERRLYESLAVEGVDSVVPVYLGLASWKNPIERNTRTLFVIGFNPKKNILDLPGVAENIDQIKLEDALLFDDQSRAEFGDIPSLFASGNPVTTELASRKVTVKGLFSLGASFTADGTVLTSDINFLRVFPERQKGLIDLGVVNIKPEADLQIVVQRLRDKLPQDVEVLSKEEFIQRDITYWQNSTAIGFIFTLGTFIGFIVGIVIVYQILYTDVADHLPEYATLKAMGYRDRYFISLVFQEAIILAFVGFLPGLGIAKVLYALTANATALPIAMTLNRAITVLILTLIMCCASGAVAIRKLNAADPADIF
ncbi:DevC protein [Xenococcus sp. PCC 7305]|uniref:ABC transporter permease DevC n=1 Tax=Xenococcus sp. PCC 7305 TaxID=102125 RepID=UPI0002AD1542|nr:ABC transporter permease DevC [Xenococcus sp. PCC 7305]ELS04649.1 DevC protein [Xenococcus sp. PCC 7305]